jgi:hypothetical protein
LALLENFLLHPVVELVGGWKDSIERNLLDFGSDSRCSPGVRVFEEGRDVSPNPDVPRTRHYVGLLNCRPTSSTGTFKLSSLRALVGSFR